MPIPLVGAALGGLIRRGAGQALRWATRGRLLGSGGGRAIAGRVGRGLIGATAGGGALELINRARRVRETFAPELGGQRSRGKRREAGEGSGKEYASGKVYRRMNPLNNRALGRAIRRLTSAEKLFKKVFRFNHGSAPVKVRPRIGR